MKVKIVPNNHEKKLGDQDFIVSKTDLTGRITYANRIFMEIAGYPESGLLGVQHNIITLKCPEVYSDLCGIP